MPPELALWHKIADFVADGNWLPAVVLAVVFVVAFLQRGRAHPDTAKSFAVTEHDWQRLSRQVDDIHNAQETILGRLSFLEGVNHGTHNAELAALVAKLMREERKR